jgi:hypothetical protein
MLEGTAVKLVMTGTAATTFTVRVLVSLAPVSRFATVSVKGVLAVRAPVL